MYALYGHEQDHLAYRLQIVDLNDSQNILKTQINRKDYPAKPSIEKADRSTSEEVLWGGKKDVREKIEKMRISEDKHQKLPRRREEADNGGEVVILWPAQSGSLIWHWWP